MQLYGLFSLGYLVVDQGLWLYSKWNACYYSRVDCNKIKAFINRCKKLLFVATCLANIVSILSWQENEFIWGQIKWDECSLKQSMWVHSLVHSIILMELSLRLWQKIIKLRLFGTSRKVESYIYNLSIFLLPFSSGPNLLRHCQLSQRFWEDRQLNLSLCFQTSELLWW